VNREKSPSGVEALALSVVLGAAEPFAGEHGMDPRRDQALLGAVVKVSPEPSPARCGQRGSKRVTRYGLCP